MVALEESFILPDVSTVVYYAIFNHKSMPCVSNICFI